MARNFIQLRNKDQTNESVVDNHRNNISSAHMLV